MNLKIQKLILHFLKEYAKSYDHSKEQDSFFEDCFNKEELIEIVCHIFGDACFEDEHLNEYSEQELYTLIKHDSFFLSYIIELLEMELGAFPSFLQADVTRFFESVNCEMHYLASKKVEAWDNYDRNNYHSLLRRMGKTRMVYAIFSSDIKEENKYEVTVFPSQFFDVCFSTQSFRPLEPRPQVLSVSQKISKRFALLPVLHDMRNPTF